MGSQPRASFHILRIVVLKAEKALLQSVTDECSTADGHIYLLAFVSKRALEGVPGSPSSEDPIDWFERAGNCLKLWCFRHPNINWRGPGVARGGIESTESVRSGHG